jgi:drug/metabolite transporter (DMT)-like permease
MTGRYFLQLILLSALWGASFLFIRIASPVLGPNVLAGVRIALATVTLAVIMRCMGERWPWARWREITLIGALSVAFPFLLFSWAALQLPAGYAALLNSTAVVFATLASAWLKEDRLNAQKLAGCVLGFAGVALIVRLGPIDPSPRILLAAAMCVMASGSYGIATPLMKRATTRIPPLAIAAGIHAVATLMLLPGAVWSWRGATFTPAAIVALLVMGIVTSGLAYWMHLRIMRHVSAVAAVSPAFLIPVFGVTWGHVFLGEPLGSGLFAGGALVLLATALVTGFNPLARWK